jgi:hypothetical protein
LQGEDLSLSDDPVKGYDERLASLERALEHMKAGLALLGVEPCNWCGIYYKSSDPGALFHSGGFACYNCIPQWWLQQSPKLNVADRQKAERDLKRWLIRYHNAEVIGRLDDLPRAEGLLVKLVIGCEECEGTGKSYTGRLCARCNGGGTVWLVVRATDSEPSS